MEPIAQLIIAEGTMFGMLAIIAGLSGMYNLIIKAKVVGQTVALFGNGAADLLRHGGGCRRRSLEVLHSLIVRQLYREIFAVADDNGEKLPQPAVPYAGKKILVKASGKSSSRLIRSSLLC